MILCEWDAPEGHPGQGCIHLYASVFYRCLSPQFQFSLSAVTLVYLSQCLVPFPALFLLILYFPDETYTLIQYLSLGWTSPAGYLRELDINFCAWVNNSSYWAEGGVPGENEPGAAVQQPSALTTELRCTPNSWPPSCVECKYFSKSTAKNKKYMYVKSFEDGY
jgi:hypothetical protein